MCGIVGWIDWEEDMSLDSKLISAMTKSLLHRGPDAGDIWCSLHCALGHRRLSIMDPANGAQPMVRQLGDETYVIVYNGEIYNAPEIRDVLKQNGVRFRTQCDTEVVLYAYMIWGTACLEQFNGIFALAIWREKEKDLFLARDRLGVKPLFYAEHSSRFWFASEPKAILTHPKFDAVLNQEGLADVLTIGPARTPGHGIFQHMHELKPGQYMIFSKHGSRLMQYWSLEIHEHGDNAITTANKVQQLVIESLHRQLRSDVPLCTFLSGGLDSSLLTAIASKYLASSYQTKLSTFSIDYVNQEQDFMPDAYLLSYDEPWAKQAAQSLGTNHQTIRLHLDTIIDGLIPAMKARDMPGMADVDSSLFQFCKEIKKQFKVAISGEASDEIFGGYPWFYQPFSMTSSSFPWTHHVERRMTCLHPEIIAWIKPMQYLQERFNQAIREVPYAKQETPEQQAMRTMSYLNITRFLPTLLDRKDRMSMATGLEVRVPFCDHHLVQYVWNIPWEFKNLHQREKGILRQAFSSWLPNEILCRKKSPFPKTQNRLFATTMMIRMREIVNDSSSPIQPLINKKQMLHLLDSYHENENYHWFGQLMTVPQLFAYWIQLDEWIKSYQIHIR